MAEARILIIDADQHLSLQLCPAKPGTSLDVQPRRVGEIFYQCNQRLKTLIDLLFQRFEIERTAFKGKLPGEQ